MGRINKDAYGAGGRPALTPEDLKGKKAAVLTVSGVDPEVKIPDTSRPGGTRLVCVLEFKEFPKGPEERVLYLNKTQVDYCIRGFDSDDTDDWVGKKIPLEIVKVNDLSSGKLKSKVYVADPDETWNEILRAGGGKRR